MAREYFNLLLSAVMIRLRAPCVGDTWVGVAVWIEIGADIAERHRATRHPTSLPSPRTHP